MVFSAAARVSHARGLLSENQDERLLFLERSGSYEELTSY